MADPKKTDRDRRLEEKQDYVDRVDHGWFGMDWREDPGDKRLPEPTPTPAARQSASRPTQEPKPTPIEGQTGPTNFATPSPKPTATPDPALEPSSYDQKLLYEWIDSQPYAWRSQFQGAPGSERNGAVRSAEFQEWYAKRKPAARPAATSRPTMVDYR